MKVSLEMILSKQNNSKEKIGSGVTFKDNKYRRKDVFVMLDKTECLLQSVAVDAELIDKRVQNLEDKFRQMIAKTSIKHISLNNVG